MTEKRADDFALSTGAFALNAMTPAERDAFEAQLAESASTREEVAGLAETATRLGYAIDPVEPSAALKASIMDRIASTPQLPRLTVADGSSDVSITEVAPSSPLLEDEPAPAFIAATTATPAGRKAESRWFTRPLVAAAGIAAAVGLIVGGVAASTFLNPAGSTQQADQLAAINASEDMQQAVASVSGGGTATLVWSNELLSSAVIVDGLEPLSASEVYELWYINDDGARPAGTFSVSEDGTAWRVLDGDMQAGDQVGVTVEPAGGSEIPTTDPIVAFQSA